MWHTKFVAPLYTSGVANPTRGRFFEVSIHIDMQSTLYIGEKTYGCRRARLNTMTFVLAPLDYRRSTETVKTIVGHFHESFGA